MNGGREAAATNWFVSVFVSKSRMKTVTISARTFFQSDGRLLVTARSWLWPHRRILRSHLSVWNWNWFNFKHLLYCITGWDLGTENVSGKPYCESSRADKLAICRLEFLSYLVKTFGSGEARWGTVSKSALTSLLEQLSEHLLMRFQRQNRVL